jgi:hypothetical protein
MTHLRLDPPRINKEDRKQRYSYCNECLERFTADDVRCSYGARYFHKECYRQWQQKKMLHCARYGDHLKAEAPLVAYNLAQGGDSWA